MELTSAEVLPTIPLSHVQLLIANVISLGYFSVFSMSSSDSDQRRFLDDHKLKQESLGFLPCLFFRKQSKTTSDYAGCLTSYTKNGKVKRKKKKTLPSTHSLMNKVLSSLHTHLKKNNKKNPKQNLIYFSEFSGDL